MVFVSTMQFIKSWKRASTSSILVICLCSFYVFSRFIDDFPLAYSGGSLVETKVVEKRAQEYLPLKLPTDKSSRVAVAPVWTYRCERQECKRTLAPDGAEPDSITSLEVCWLTCGSHGALWPFPRKEILKATGSVAFLPENIHLTVEAGSETVQNLVKEVFQLKKTMLEHHRGLKPRNSRSGFSWFLLSNTPFGYHVEVVIHVADPQETFHLNTDETYELNVVEKLDVATPTIVVTIRGKTFFGVRHGLETWSQLIGLNEVDNCLQIVKSYSASDGPRFPYRGILIDSGRNFLPLDVIKRVVDTMSFNKLNMLHWHISDSNSFPFYSKRVPQMTEYGALQEEIYHPNEVTDLVNYARLRGVKIIPEIDTPSHAGSGWQFGERYGLGKLAYYINEYGNNWPSICSQPPCGILNPINVNTYNVLRKRKIGEEIYADIFDAFDKDLFHMGGDEVTTTSWTRIGELRDWLKGQDAMELWRYFQTEAMKRLKSQSDNVTAILWTSKLTESDIQRPFLDPKDYIIQVWEPMGSRQTMELLQRGFPVILSFVDAMYLDWGGGTWLGRNHDWHFHNWQKLYDVKFDYNSHSDQILGGEAPLWGEKVGGDNLETKLWPRAFALAEKLWSNPSGRGEHEYSRLNYHVYRTRRRGIPVSLLQPQSCLHFNGHCRNPRDVL